MSRIVTFTPLGTSARANPDETVLDAARRAGAPLGNSCGGIGVCGRCRVRVVEGAENLASPTLMEIATVARLGFPLRERLACMAVVHGNCEVTTGYW